MLDTTYEDHILFRRKQTSMWVHQNQQMQTARGQAWKHFPAACSEQPGHQVHHESQQISALGICNHFVTILWDKHIKFH